MGNTLIKQYISTGRQIPEKQVKKLNTNQLKTYLYHRSIAVKQNVGVFADYEAENKIAEKIVASAAKKIDENNKKYVIVFQYEDEENYKPIKYYVLIFDHNDNLIQKIGNKITAYPNVTVNGIKNTFNHIMISEKYDRRYLANLTTGELIPIGENFLLEYNKEYNVFITTVLAKQDFKYSFINEKGKIVLENIEFYQMLENGVMTIKKNQKYNLLGKDFTPIFENWAEYIWVRKDMLDNEKTKNMVIVKWGEKQTNVYNLNTSKFMFDKNKQYISIENGEITGR